jgi:ABC-type cobalamin/Fe3+-siderophores transport system ATPase subunit
MVLHDLHLAMRFADYAIAVGGGSARTGAAADILSAAALSELFGHRLVQLGEGRTSTFVPS